MSRFPAKESDIVILALEVELGLHSNGSVYPSPPLSGQQLACLVNSYQSAADAATSARAALPQTGTDKDAALESLVDAIKTNLRYAENTVKFDDDKLKLIGRSGKRAKSTLYPPGQPRDLEAPRQGEGWLFLDWKKPHDGGKPAAYTVQRRIVNENGKWQTVSTALETETTLVNQPRGKFLEYQIIAVNKAGPGTPSNMVEAVL